MLLHSTLGVMFKVLKSFTLTRFCVFFFSWRQTVAWKQRPSDGWSAERWFRSYLGLHLLLTWRGGDLCTSGGHKGSWEDAGGSCGGQACCTASSCPMKRRRRSRYWLYNSTSLCPAPSTHRGSTAFGQRSNRAKPCEKSITSSSVPWMMSTGEVIFDTFSMLKMEHKGNNGINDIYMEKQSASKHSEIKQCPFRSG